MNTTIYLFCIGWVAVILIQLFRPELKYRQMLVLFLSASFMLYAFNNIWMPFIYLAWILLVYYLMLNGHKKYITKIYFLAVVVVFILIKGQWILIDAKNPLMEVSIPLGFSFMMFHSFALLQDSANKVLNKKVIFLEYAASALYFPTFSAGPFHKIQVFQEKEKHTITGVRSFEGYCLFCLGTFKFALSGILLSKDLLGVVPIYYVKGHSLHPINILMLSSIYLYTNFSGYSDIVVGFSKMMGFEIPINFKFPFFSISLAEYWRKWHITLGAWFKEYVFFPLNYYLIKKLSKKISSDFLTKVSIFITFLLIGIWHQFSLKILTYSIFNALLVAFFFPKNKKWWGYLTTFFLALIINLLFVSAGLKVFVEIMTSFFSALPDTLIYKNVMVLVMAIILFVIIFYLEKLIDKISSANEGNAEYFVFGMNFIVSIVTLFLGITWGTGHLNAVYVGY
ncbi:MAG: MBOAT family O-acyltransferase [Pseudobdellovibrio sp.]